MIRTLALCLVLLACLGPAAASAQGVRMAPLSPQSGRMISDYVEAAERLLPRLPAVALTSVLHELCEGEGANPLMRYCTSENRIYVSFELAEAVPDDGRAGYMIAHMLGHAAQVRHGIADDALAAIRAEPSREAELRGMVTRQVECIAGVIFGLAGGPTSASLARWFESEPFTDAHWGRTPVRSGPKVSIGLKARDEWFRKGLRAGDLAACSVGEISAGKLVRAAAR